LVSLIILIVVGSPGETEKHAFGLIAVGSGGGAGGFSYLGGAVACATVGTLGFLGL